MQTSTVPNHHRHHGGFSGLSGYLIGVGFLFGRNQVGAWAADLAGVGPADSVVDIGCGPGNAARVAAKRGATVVGVDPAAVMLRLARTVSIGRKNLAFRTGAAEHLPVEDGEASVVWSLSTVHHWADLDAGLYEVRRVLKPGGRFVAIESDTLRDTTRHASHGWTDGQVDAFVAGCETAGFTEIRIERGMADNRPRIAVVATR